MLTKRQNECLQFLIRYMNEQGGVSPSMLEITHALGCENKSSAHRLLNGLEERGFIRKLPHRARAIEILRVPAKAPPKATVTSIPIFDADTHQLRGYLP